MGVKTKLYTYLTLFLCVIALSQSTAYAQTIDTLKNVQKVVVKASRLPREVIPVQTLSAEQMKRMSTYSVADAVRYFSGVQIKDYGGIGGLKTVNIRSMGSQHVGVFYDGIELGNAQNGIVDLGRFSIDNIESISLYNGQKSAIFQPAKDFSTASAIYMQTRRPTFDYDKKYNINVGLKLGSFATANPSFLWEHKINDSLASSFSAEYLYTSGRYKFSYATKGGYDTTAYRQNGDVNALRVEGGLFGTVKNGQWQTKLYIYNSERGYPGAVVREEPGKFKNADRQWDNNVFLQGSYQQNLAPFYTLKASAKMAYDYLRYKSDPSLDASAMFVDNEYKQGEVYGSLANLFSIKPWWSASLSVDYQYNTLSANLPEFVFPSRHQLFTAVATSFDFKKFKLQTSLLYTYVNDETKKLSSAADDKGVFTPSVVAAYTPFNDIKLSVRAFYKKSMRLPTLNDLYYTLIGNVDLNPEYTTQYNLGLVYSNYFNSSIVRSIYAQVDCYYNQVQDKIVAIPTSNQFRWTMLNLGYVEIRGTDVNAKVNWRFGEVDVVTNLNYTYQKAQDFTDPKSEYYGGQVPYIPTHSGSAILGVNYRKWGMNYSFIYTGERYDSKANTPANYVQPWYTHDLSFSRSIEFKNSYKLDIVGEINNLLNQQYEVVARYPMPGINFRLKLKFII